MPRSEDADTVSWYSCEDYGTRRDADVGRFLLYSQWTKTMASKMFAGYIVSNTYTFCLSITKSCFLNCLELKAKFMLKKLNYMYISMFLIVSRLFISVSWDVGQIIPLQLEFPQLKFIPQYFYFIKYIINILIVILQVIVKVDAKPHRRGRWFGFCSSHTCSLICVLYNIKDHLFQEICSSFLCVLCVNHMCKMLLNGAMLKKYYK
jgi:hypothetical protein